MNEKYWNVFTETGDPMSFLLCKAAEKTTKPDEKKNKNKKKSEKPPQTVM